MSTRDYNVQGFTKVSIHWPLEFEIVRADKFAVSASGSDTQLHNIFATVEGDKLTIGYELNLISFFTAPFSRISARITLPDLQELSISGAARGTVDGFSSAHDFALYISGASRVDFHDIAVGKMKWDISGASKIEGSIKAADEFFMHLTGASRIALKGAAKDLDLNAAGASVIELGDFPVHNAKVRLTGASRCAVNLDGRLDLNADGASHLEFSGTPTMGETRMSGASTMHKR